MMFDLQKHIDFLKRIEGDQKYDTHGIGHYSNTVCPICGSEKIFIHDRGGGDEFHWAECEDCHWMGDKKDVPTLEEYVNKNRTNLIEKMLNDKNDKNDIFD